MGYSSALEMVGKLRLPTFRETLHSFETVETNGSQFTMNTHNQALGNDIQCIDTGLYRHGLAACYLIREQDRVAFVDTGTSHTVPGLLGLLQSMGLGPENVDYVIPTHVHLDHAGGAGQLMSLCPNARLVIHPKGAPHMIDPAKLTAGATVVYGEEAFTRDFGELLPIPQERVIAAEDGMQIDLAGRTLRILDTPGHANHHFCVFDTVSRGFFTGDTFGIAYRELHGDEGPLLFAPTTPVAFDPEAWQDSLDRMMAWDPQVMYLTHYGPLPQPQLHLATLRHSIRDMADIALAEESREDAGRDQRLRRAVEENLIRRMEALGCTLTSERIRELLSVDIELNAQGLDVWLKRRAKARSRTTE
jgi:glyoxylase-like metal-dependent hydrolase (beta-lactamase superfamily II)